MTYKIKDATKTPPAKLKAGSEWNNQRVLYITNFYGKEYYWLKDLDGTHWLARIGPDGNPVLL